MEAALKTNTLNTPTQSPRLWLIAKIVPVLIPVVFFLHNGMMGLDFGLHWDEPSKTLAVSNSLESGVLVPLYFQKPGVIYWLTLASIAPELPEIIRSEPKSYMIAIKERIDQPDYMLMARAGHLTIASLTILWMYILVWLWRKNWIEALIASSLIALSWEVLYHSRFVATDSTVMSFTMLTLLLCYISYRNPERRFWVWWAAIAAGFALGSKYNAGLIIIPLWLLVYFNWDRNSWVDLLARLFAVSVIFAASYIFTTPGTILAPERFISDVAHEFRHYGVEGHGRYSVLPGIDHFGRNLYYLAVVGFSPYPVISISVFAVSIFGIVQAFRKEPKLITLLLSFPVIYLLYMSTQQVLFVRNLLLWLPLLAIFAAYGIIEITQRFPQQHIKIGFGIILIAVVVVNINWLNWTANTITQRGTSFYLEQMVTHLESNPQQTFSASQQVWDSLQQSELEVPANLTLNSWDESNFGLVYIEEVNSSLPANLPFLVDWFGPYQVNLNYYSSWKLNEHILLMTSNTIEQYDVLRNYQSQPDS